MKTIEMQSHEARQRINKECWSTGRTNQGEYNSTLCRRIIEEALRERDKIAREEVLYEVLAYLRYQKRGRKDYSKILGEIYHTSSDEDARFNEEMERLMIEIPELEALTNLKD